MKKVRAFRLYKILLKYQRDATNCVYRERFLFAFFYMKIYDAQWKTN